MSEWFFAGVAPAALAAILVGGALLVFPIYFWLHDRRRRGEPVSRMGLLGATAVGLLGILAMWSFFQSRF